MKCDARWNVTSARFQTGNSDMYILVILCLVVGILVIPLPLRDTYNIHYAVHGRATFSDGTSPSSGDYDLCLQFFRKKQQVHQFCQPIHLSQDGKLRQMVFDTSFTVRTFHSFWNGAPPATLFRRRFLIKSKFSQKQAMSSHVLVFKQTGQCEKDTCTGNYGIVGLLAYSRHHSWISQMMRNRYQQTILGDIIYLASSTRYLSDPQDPNNTVLLQLIAQANTAYQDTRLFDECAKRNEWNSWVYLGTKGVLLVIEAMERYDMSEKPVDPNATPVLPSESTAKKKKDSLFASFLKSQYKAYQCRQAKGRAQDVYLWAHKSAVAKIAGQTLPQRPVFYRLRNRIRSVTDTIKNLFRARPKP